MKVLHVTNAYPSSQSPIYGIFIKEQIDTLTNPDHKAKVFFINAKKKGKTEYLKSYFKLLKLAGKYDIIHCHHAFCALLVLLTFPRAKVLVSFLSEGSKELTFKTNVIFAEAIYKFIVRKTDGRIFKSTVPQSLRDDRYTFYLPNGVDTKMFVPMDKNAAKRAIGLSPEKRYILFVSSNMINRPEKRYDIYKRTVELLKTKYHFADIEELSLVNIEREKVPFYFCSSELHLLTSEAEGSPNSVKESISCNIPVVATAVGNVEDMLEGVTDCYVSSGNDPEILAEYCNKVLNRKSVINIRKYLFSKEMDMDSVRKKLENIYTVLYIRS
jgi:glycosyltransferase involved in cell wall biosynthesis